MSNGGKAHGADRAPLGTRQNYCAPGQVDSAALHKKNREPPDSGSLNQNEVGRKSERAVIWRSPQRYAKALYLNAVFLEHLMHTLLVHRSKGPSRHLEGDGPIQFRDKDLFGDKVRALDAFGLAL